MSSGPAPGPGRDEDPARRARGPGDPLQDASAGWRRLPAGPDWMDEDLWAARPVGEEPSDPDRYRDPEDPPLPGEVDLEALLAGCRELTVAGARAAAMAAAAGTTADLAAAAAAAAGRRGPGMPGSGCLPGEYPGPAGGFASGLPLDTAPGGLVLMGFAGDAAGADDTYPGATDDELIGAICAWDRVQAHAAARKHGASAEFIRRRPAPGCVLEGPARMPAGWQEFVPDELAPALAVSAWAAAEIVGLAWDLEVKLPGTRAAFRAGILAENKARIISAATQLLDPAEARAAEALVLDRVGALTPGGLRAAIARAVMQVAPDKARKRREEAVKDARVERWAEDSGNAALVGRELPPAEVLAADQRVTWWAKQLRQAGLAGSMDELRARAYLDLLLGMDSRPARQPGRDGHAADGPRPDGHGADDPGTGDHASGPGPDDPGPDDDGPDDDGTDDDGTDNDGTDNDGTDNDGTDGHGMDGGGSGPPKPAGPVPAGPTAGVIPPGFAGRLNLTVPLATALGLADRPGEAAGIGPVDPWLARDLAAAAARNPATTWCLTVTDQHGRPVGHGCARPASAAAPARPAARPDREARAGPGPPHPAEPQPGFTIGREHGPPGSYGTWRLSTGIPGQRDLIIAVEPIGTDPCDHRHQAPGHDPGVMLRHLAEIRYGTCTGPACRRPAAQADFEHNIPYEAGGRSCLCNCDPKCRHDHRVKQHPRWHVDQLPDGTVRWTTPAGRQYTKEPARYPI
jgi:uncharacterized protein DUF222